MCLHMYLCLCRKPVSEHASKHSIYVDMFRIIHIQSPSFSLTRSRRYWYTRREDSLVLVSARSRTSEQAVRRVFGGSYGGRAQPAQEAGRQAEAQREAAAEESWALSCVGQCRTSADVFAKNSGKVWFLAGRVFTCTEGAGFTRP